MRLRRVATRPGVAGSSPMVSMRERIEGWAAANLNFYRVHVLFFILFPLASSLIFYYSSPVVGEISFVNSLFSELTRSTHPLSFKFRYFYSSERVEYTGLTNTLSLCSGHIVRNCDWTQFSRFGLFDALATGHTLCKSICSTGLASGILSDSSLPG